MRLMQTILKSDTMEKYSYTCCWVNWFKQQLPASSSGHLSLFNTFYLA